MDEVLTPTPIPTELTRPYWEATTEHRLLVQRCGDRVQWYPRAHCLHDLEGGHEPEWVEVSGRGTVFSYSVVYRSPFADLDVPYVVAIVELEEGVHVTGRIVGASVDEVQIGKRVAVFFEARKDGFHLPVFELIRT